VKTSERPIKVRMFVLKNESHFPKALEADWRAIMPHVSKQSQVPRQGVHSQKDRKVMAQPDLPRDDLQGAVSGDENEGPIHTDKDHSHSTQLKSRATEKSKHRTPVR